MIVLPAFILAAALTFAVTPMAIRVARRIGFLDHPVAYKAHWGPTPYLGGAAVFAGFAVAAIAFGDATGRFAALFGCAAGLLALGTLDDRIPVPPRWRWPTATGRFPPSPSPSVAPAPASCPGISRGRRGYSSATAAACRWAYWFRGRRCWPPTGMRWAGRGCSRERCSWGS